MNKQFCLLVFTNKGSGQSDVIQMISDIMPEYAKDPIHFYYATPSIFEYDKYFPESKDPKLVLIVGKKGKYASWSGG